MNRNLVLILGLLFLVSAGLNLYLYTEVKRYEDAWVEQIITTSEIEAILGESEADTSFEGIKRLAIARFGSEAVRVVKVSDIHIDWGSDRDGLKVNETLLLFKEGVCSGSMIPDTNVGGNIATINEVSDDQKTTFLYA